VGLDLLFMTVGVAIFFALDQHHQWARQRMKSTAKQHRWGMALFAGVTALIPMLSIGVVTYFIASQLSPGGVFELQDRQILAMLMGYCMGLLLLQAKSS